MKIFCVDTGYGEQDWKGHGTVVIDIIKHYNSSANIVSLSNDQYDDLKILEMNLYYVLANCSKDDILITPWNIPRNQHIDQLFVQIAEKCKRIVCTAGNNKDLMLEDLTPANLVEVCDVIHCVRKTGKPASFATLSSGTKGMYGTNVTCPDGIVRSGSTISAAIYCGIISRNDSEKFLRRVTRLIGKKYLQELLNV